MDPVVRLALQRSLLASDLMIALGRGGLRPEQSRVSRDGRWVVVVVSGVKHARREWSAAGKP